VSIWQTLLDVVILLGGGALLGGLFERARHSAIIGYVLAGVLLGPNVFHVIRGTDEVLALSELGVTLLLFVIGLEFSWPRLRGMGVTALGAGLLQIVGTALVGALAASFLGLGPAAALTLGAICALSSTACVLRVLTAHGEVETVHGERALGILLVQDMAVVPLVLIVSVLAEGGSAGEIVGGILRAAGLGLALVIVLFIVFHKLVPRLFEAGPVHANRELPLLVAVVSGLGSGVAAHEAGVSPALGAFVAGLLLAESPFAVQVRADVSSLKTLLLALFFAAIGMLADPMWIARNAGLVAGVVAVVMVGKAAIVWTSLRVFGARSRTAVTTGVCLAQVGEFSFVLAEIARGTLLDERTFLLVVSATVITMMLTPSLVKRAPRIAALMGGPPIPPPDDGLRESLRGAHGIVIGYGPAGRAASERIAELGFPVVVVEQTPGAARDAHRLGHYAITGDARYAEVLDYAGLDNAAFIVVTVPAADVALQIARYVRAAAPNVPLLVRARFHRWLPALQEAGAHVIVDEEQEVGRLIAAAAEERIRAARASNPDEAA